MTRVLAVCLGNICRSPTAEAALRDAAERAGIDLEVDSAGTAAYHVGAAPDARMTRAAAADGLVLDGRARKATADDLDRFDLVLAMDRQNLADLRALARDDAARARVRLFRDFADEFDQDVPDPYYGGEDGFHEVVRIVRRAADGVIEAIRNGDV